MDLYMSIQLAGRVPKLSGNLRKEYFHGKINSGCVCRVWIA